MAVMAVVTIVVGSFSAYLFKQAAGTLALGKINIVSYAYYILLLQTVLGCLLVSLGFDEHYTLGYLIDEYSIVITTQFVWVVLLLLPLTMMLYNRLIHFDPSKEYLDYSNREVLEKDDNIVFVVLCIACIVQIIALVLFLSKIGYIPLLKLVHHEDSFDFGLERIKIQGMTLFGNSTITNLIIRASIPIVAFITTAYALINKKTKWIILAVISVSMGVIVKTIDFSKSPLIFFFIVFLFIVVNCHRGGIKNRIVVSFACIMGVFLVVIYYLEGYKGQLFDLYNGIVGRTIFTQYGTLCYHFDLFPTVFDYLNGRSLSPTVLNVIGINPELHLRSAELVMNYYGIEKVYDGTAGVMNGLFIGEAYANWGVIGVFLSIIWVGIVIGFLFSFFIKVKKTPVSVAIYAFFIQTTVTMMNGGFVDFVYNLVNILVFVGGIVLMYYKNIFSFVQAQKRKVFHE